MVTFGGRVPAGMTALKAALCGAVCPEVAYVCEEQCMEVCGQYLGVGGSAGVDGQRWAQA